MAALAAATSSTDTPAITQRQDYAVLLHDAAQVIAGQPDSDAGARELEAFEAGVSRCTVRELRLCVELAAGRSTPDALRLAGYSFNGDGQYKANRSLEIRRRPRVAAVIAGLRRAGVMRAEVKVAQVTAEQARIAFSNVNHYQITNDGEVKCKPGAPLDAVQAVSRVEIEEVETVTDRGSRIRRKKTLHLWNKSSALKALAADLGMASGGDAGKSGDVNVSVAIVEVHGGQLGMHREAAKEVGTVEIGGEGEP